MVAAAALGASVTVPGTGLGFKGTPVVWAVVPEWVKQQIALMSVVSATSRAAAVMALAMDGSAGVRARDTISR